MNLQQKITTKWDFKLVMVIVPSNFRKKVIKQLKSNCSVGFQDVNVYSDIGFRPNQIICIAYIIVLHMLTCIAHICFIYKDIDVYFLMMKYNIIHLVFLTWYQSHLLVAMIFCPYSIFKSSFCLPRCFFAMFIFFGFLLLPSKLSGIVMPTLKVASTLQDHYLP